MFHVPNRKVSRMKSKYFTYQTEMLQVPNIKRAGREYSLPALYLWYLSLKEITSPQSHKVHQD
ncbi:Uncharacterised protein [Chlamydia trachomatis]|nr:Uncharacterised protein [Chlamydia trachomatis]